MGLPSIANKACDGSRVFNTDSGGGTDVKTIMEIQSKIETCRGALENATGIPQKFVEGSDMSPEGFIRIYTAVEPFPECKSGAVMDSYFGDNQADAKSCAESLKRMHPGQKYEATKTSFRLLFSNVWTVQVKK